MQCIDCGTTTGRIIKSKRFGVDLCSKCYQLWSAANGRPKEHPLPSIGEITFDEQGFPICHVCGRAYKKLLMHVYQKHDMSEKEYKEKFGLDRTKGIVADSTKRKLQKSVKEHYNLVVKRNLLKGGKKTRFHVGDQGRTIDKCSPQTLERLKNWYWNGKFKKQEK